MGFFLILILIGVAAFAFYYYRRTGHFLPGMRRDEEDAISVAKRRYANGEITRDEFERIRRDLEEDRRT